MLHRASDLQGSCDHDNQPSGSIGGKKFHDYLSNY